MSDARARCWIHEDCLVDLELSIACGPNPLDMQVLEGDWADDADFGGGYGNGRGGDGDGDGGGFGDGDDGDGAGDGYCGGGRGCGEVDGGQW